jgi:KUP system potassium uptake protein
MNWTLAFATLAAVIGFGSSDALAGAFGIAVSLLMAITTLMATFVALHWKHNPFVVYMVNGSLLLLDLLFFASTSTKLLEGGWFPLAIALIISFLMLTWRKGEEIMDKVRLEVRQNSKEFIEGITAKPPFRLPGTAIILGRMTRGVPLALTQNLKLNHVLHEKVLLVAVETAETPRVADEDRAVVTPICDGIARVALRFGFMEQPNVPWRLRLFNHLVSDDEQSIRHLDCQRLRGAQVDDQFELGRPYDGHFGGLFSFENPGSIDALEASTSWRCSTRN